MGLYCSAYSNLALRGRPCCDFLAWSDVSHATHTSNEALSDGVFVARRETILFLRLFWSNSCLLLAPNASVARKSCYHWYKVQRFLQHFTPVQFEV